MSIERRFKARYPIELNVRYQTYGQTKPVSGIGRTVNFSSSGVLIAASETPADGDRLKLVVEWPSLLNGTTPLQLIMFGRVVRLNDSGFAVALEHYQFRTMKRTASNFSNSARVGSGEAVPPAHQPSVGTPAKHELEVAPLAAKS